MNISEWVPVKTKFNQSFMFVGLCTIMHKYLIHENYLKKYGGDNALYKRCMCIFNVLLIINILCFVDTNMLHIVANVIGVSDNIVRKFYEVGDEDTEKFLKEQHENKAWHEEMMKNLQNNDDQVNNVNNNVNINQNENINPNPNHGSNDNDSSNQNNNSISNNSNESVNSNVNSNDNSNSNAAINNENNIESDNITAN